MASVMGVQGPVEADALGLTLPHEHLFVDLRCYCPSESVEGPFTEPVEGFTRRDKPMALRELYNSPVSLSLREQVLQHPWDFRDNPLLDDEDSALREARTFAALGGRTIADLSCSAGMGRQPQKLRMVSALTGVNVIMSAGRYTFPSMTDNDKQMTVDEIESQIYGEFVHGVDGGIHPGLLKAGFVDCLDREPEIRTLRAVGRVQSKVGCALAVHPHIWKPDSHQILDILEEEGCDLRRVILCHQDFLGNSTQYLDSLCKHGAFIEFDTFGCGWINDPMWQQTDAEKIGFLEKQIELGNQQQLLISGDMCLKIMLSKWGGIGYVNIPKLIIPQMQEAGFSPDLIRLITEENPARVFCH